MRVLPSALVEFAIWVQDLLQWWVLGCLIVGGGLLVGGARAAGAALVGSSFCSFLAYPLKGLYGGDHLETLVHGAVILSSVGLVGFGLAGLALGTHRPLGRYPMALVLAFGTVVVGTRLVTRDPRRGGSALFAAVVLPGVRGALGPGAACIQRRLPRGAVPGAGQAGVAVIGGGRPHRGLDLRFRSWRAAVPPFAVGPSQRHRKVTAGKRRGNGPSLPPRGGDDRHDARARSEAGWLVGWAGGVRRRRHRPRVPGDRGRRASVGGDVGPGSASCTDGRSRS